MDPERWQRIRGVFERALDAPSPDAREELLRAACGGDEDLRRRVDELLASDTEADDRLDSTPTGELLGAFEPLQPGDRIAGYEIRRKIGSGGMGTVYEAIQDQPRRTVAIKLSSHGLPSPNALRRFQLEAEVLARLRHPAIAQVFEAGTFTPAGSSIAVPFFAMECIEDARDLAAYAAGEGLPRRALLELLIEVCDAVHHAHLNGVVHRDLKPANVLVDRQGRPKLIDFGIARPIETARATVLTRTGLVLGTLEYASPEQIAGRADAVDARTDVYSLGVIAFRLLSGRLPHRLDGLSLPAAAREIAERDAPRLGTVDRGLRGDLETIVAKALEKDPARRYRSAAEFGQDLANLLEDRPILARPPSATYQLGKLVKRHRAASAAALVAVLALIAGSIAVFLQSLRIADEQRRTARVSEFLRGIVAEADAFERGRDFTMRQALDAAATEIEGSFGDDPLLEAEIRHVVGDTYRQLTELAAADRHLTRAWELRRARLGADALESLDTEESLALLRWAQDRADEAVVLMQHAVAARQRAHGPRDPRTLGARHDLALFLKAARRSDEAEAEYRRVLAARREVLGDDDPATLVTWHNLAKLLFDAGRDAEAGEMLRAVLAMRERVLGAEHPDTLITLDVLGLAARRAGDARAAARAHRRTRAGFAARLGDDHEHTLGASMHLVWALLTDGEAVEAVPIAEDTLARCERVFGPEHAHTLQLLRMTAAALGATGQSERAGDLLRRAHEGSVRRHGPSDPDSVRAAYDLAFWLHGQERHAEGLALVQEAAAARQAASAPADTLDGEGLMIEGLCLVGLDRYEQAERVLQASLELHREVRGPHSEETLGSLNCLVRLYEVWDRPVDLARCRDEADAVRAARSVGP